MDPEGRSYYRCGRNDVLALIPADASRILDVGCGEGVLGQLLLERGATEVVGIEAEPAAAAAARKRLSRVFPGDVEVMDLPFDDGYFDCIVLADVLEHLRDPLAALKKLKRHLSDSGTVVASMPNVRYLPVVERLAGGRWEYKDSGILDRTHLRFFTRKEMELLFRDAGFEPEGVSENLSPAYDSLPPAHAGELSFGCVTLRGQTSEEIKDLFVFQYLFRARKAGIATRSTIAGAEAALSSGDLEGARAALERRLLESPLDMEALLAHSDVAFRLGMREAALEDLDRILLFEPGARGCPAAQGGHRGRRPAGEVTSCRTIGTMEILAAADARLAERVRRAGAAPGLSVFPSKAGPPDPQGRRPRPLHSVYDPGPGGARLGGSTTAAASKARRRSRSWGSASGTTSRSCCALRTGR
jgi:SAM-dependent methyltransferase